MIDKQKEEKKKQVYNILMTPIRCKERCDTIKRVKDETGAFIQTGQKYYSTLDEDMSDFAVGFYKIVYRNFLIDEEMLNCYNRFISCCFAGDTMNSFNIIKRNVKAKDRESLELLEGYQAIYHCLANFWVIPAPLGRKGTKGNNLDSMDVFLDCLGREDGYIRTMSSYSTYFSAVNNYKVFCDIHCVGSGNYKSEANIRATYNDLGHEKLQELIEGITFNIRARAERIAKLYVDDLYKYFEDKKLLEPC